MEQQQGQVTVGTTPVQVAKAKAFAVGSIYTTRSACDHACVISVSVLSRTAKTIKADCGHRGIRTLRIAEYDGVEFVKPWGSYSMAPVVSA